MKKNKILLSAFIALAFIGSALATTKHIFDQGDVWCESTCTTAPIDFKLDPNGNFTDVCGITNGIENTEYHKVSAVCTAIPAGQKYSATRR